MPEFYVRLDVYLQAASLDAAIEKAMDAVSGVAYEVWVGEDSGQVPSSCIPCVTGDHAGDMNVPGQCDCCGEILMRESA